MVCACLCGCCFGCILTMLNTLFGMIGLVLIGIGTALHFFADIASSFLQNVLDQMKDMFSTFGFSISDIIKGDSTVSILSILKQVGIPLIIIGVILVVICILGCCSVYCSNRILLIVYISILGAILGAQIIAAIIIGLKIPDYRTSMIDGLKNSINNDYEGRTESQNNGSNLFTSIVDLVQVSVHCCGIDNYTNFDTATKWQMRKEHNERIPATCCVMANNKPKDAAKCSTALDPEYAYILYPCFSAVDDFTGQYKSILIGVVAGILGFQAIILLLAICFCQTVSASKIGPV